jgi:hypothetical protein
MPYRLEQGPQPRAYSRDLMHEVHRHAPYVWNNVIVPVIEAGTFDLARQTVSLEQLRTVVREQSPATSTLPPPPPTCAQAEFRKTMGMLDELARTAQWRVLFIRKPVVDPVGVVYFMVFFEREYCVARTLATIEIWTHNLRAVFRGL